MSGGIAYLSSAVAAPSGGPRFLVPYGMSDTGVGKNWRPMSDWKRRLTRRPCRIVDGRRLPYGGLGRGVPFGGERSTGIAWTRYFDGPHRNPPRTATVSKPHPFNRPIARSTVRGVVPALRASVVI